MSLCPDIVVLEEASSRLPLEAPAHEVRLHLDNCSKCRATFDELCRNARLLEPLRCALRTDSPGPVAAMTGAAIGRYELRGVLGRGGMATVYRATQDHPRRDVALKVMKYDLAPGPAQQRFHHEIDILGRLKHPGIAQIFETGTVDIGFGLQPYFAMELVEGRKLTDYAEEQNLSLRQRLELFAKVCDAVEYAHQKGVIHRDLKPSNILVLDEAGTKEKDIPAVFSFVPQPKILDFGVARAMNADLSLSLQPTEVGQLVGTLPYMSPEQAAGNPDEIDTRSDVYTLGVIGYLLLGGRLPYEVTGRPLAEAVRIVREKNIVPLGTICKGLRGDLETIMGKALERDKTRRYASVTALLEDIRRHLHDEPIAARSPSAGYQLRKFVRRHWTLVGALAGVFFALLLGLGGTGYWLVRAVDAEREGEERRVDAEKRRAEAESITRLLKEMLAAADPEIRKHPDYTVRELLDEFAKGLVNQLQDQPEVEATLRATVGRTYRSLSLYQPAEQQLRLAMDLRRKSFGPEHEAVAETLYDLAWVLHDKTQYTEALNLHEEAMRIQQLRFGKEHADIAKTLHAIGDIRRHLGALVEAETLLNRALDMRRRLLTSGHPEIAESLSCLALTLTEMGRFTEAAPLIQEALLIWRTAYGDQHPRVADGLSDEAELLWSMGDLEGAEQKYRQVLDLTRRILGKADCMVANCLASLGGVLWEKGDLEQAERLLRESVDVHVTIHGAEHAHVATTIGDLGWVLLDQGKPEQAEPLLAQAVRVLRTSYSAEHYVLGSYLLGYGRCLTSLRRFDEAEQLLDESWTILTKVLEPGHWRIINAARGLADLYDASDKPEQAAPFRAMLPDAEPSIEPVVHRGSVDGPPPGVP